jgi:hypothetical protein
MVEVPGEVSVVPAGQSFTDKQVDWFSSVVNVSAGQGAHCRSVVAVGRFIT